MTSGVDDYTQKLLDRTRARNEALQQKMQQHAFTNKKRRPLEAQENVGEALGDELPRHDSSLTDKSEVASPNKRSRLDDENLTQTSVKATQSKAEEKSIGERMQRLLNQRKQWEAADDGNEVDFDVIPSPIYHKQDSPAASLQSRRKIDVERKARLAAFAKEINSREDDLNRPVLPRSDKDLLLTPEKSSFEPGRKTPMSDVYRSETTSSFKEVYESTSKESSRPSRVVSQRVSLSIETLSQFAHKDKASSTQIAPKTPIQKKLSSDVVSVAAFKKDTETIGHQVTPTSKTLQERLLELQKNGCNAERTSTLSKPVVENMEVAPTKEEDKDDVVVSDGEESFVNNQSIITNEEEERFEEFNQSENCDSVLLSSGVEQDIEQDITGTKPTTTVLNNTNPSECDEEADESGMSFGDSMMQEELDDNQEKTSTATQCDMSDSYEMEDSSSSLSYLQSHVLSMSAVSENESVLSNEVTSEESSRSNAGSDVDDVDDLFDGVSRIDDEVMNSPIMSDISNKGRSTLTRQKSRLEIKTELIVRKQTCNEAEDTHVIRRHPSRHLRPMARSTSVESIVSLGTEKPEPEKNVPIYTIDSYRMEKRKSLRSVDKKIIRNENVRPKSDDVTQKSRISSLKERNSRLLNEVQHQQRVIQQASAALNCCYDVHHGKGSITELEAEKLLLIASEKRLALLTEIQKLKAGRSEGSTSGFKSCQGSLIIENFQLPLRTEYIFSMASKKDGGDTSNHYYFILVRNGAKKIFATHLASTRDDLTADSLLFKDKFSFDALDSDFEINIEVYSVNHRNRAFGVPNQEKPKKKIAGILQKRKSVDVKKKLGFALEKTRQKVKQVGDSATCSLIRSRDQAKLYDSLTPRKHKARSIHGSVPASPGGPNAVRSSSFTPIGGVTIRLDDVKRNKFVLQKVPFLSPISGQLGCKISTNFKSNAQQRGFLTTFNDVGGMGAWHRRWCSLHDGVLYSWTYPDDEKYKEPLNKLELRQCISNDVRTVERIMCARPNTFELRTMRPRKDGDKENLISQDTGSVITTRHWLAADTKEERALWVESLNQALMDVRSWDLTSLKPLS